MKALSVTILAGALLFAQSAAAQTANAKPACGGCAQKASTPMPATQPIPGTNETMLVGTVENLVPIAVVSVLGCETCAVKAVDWALQQGSSPEDVDRVLRTVAAMQNLDCFKQQFGADAATRLERPLAAAREALRQAAGRASK
jgi:alkylhydroperoxidase/carboxymuconolactone decarboxylase family protein YurZ